MKVCEKCGSTDIAQSVWMHINTIGVIPMHPTVTFYWCFNCNSDTTIMDKADLVKKLLTDGNTSLQKMQITVSEHTVREHLRIKTSHLSPAQINYHKDEWHRNEFRVRMWILVKNARRYKNQNDVVWDSEKNGKVQVWKTLKPQIVKRHKK